MAKKVRESLGKGEDTDGILGRHQSLVSTYRESKQSKKRAVFNYNVDNDYIRLQQKYESIIYRQQQLIRALRQKIVEGDSAEVSDTVVLYNVGTKKISFDRKSGDLLLNDSPVDDNLTPVEAGLFGLLLDFSDIVLSSDMLSVLLNEQDEAIIDTDNLTGTYISYLKSKLKSASPLVADQLINVYGVGYKFELRE